MILVIIVLLCNTAIAYTELEAYDEKCYKDGSFSFIAKNGKTEPLATSTIDVTYRHESTRIFSPVNGTWDMEEMYLSVDDKDKEQAMYVSPRGLLEEEGEYFVYLDYPGCKKDRCLETVALKSCPGYVHDCEKRDAKATACFHRGRDLYIRFEMDDKRYLDVIDVSRDLVYYIYSNEEDREGEKRPFGIEIEQLSENSYQAKLPLRENEIVSKIGVTHGMCKSDSVKRYNTIDCSYYVPLEDREESEELEDEGEIVTDEGMTIRKIEKDDVEETSKEAEEEFEEYEELEEELKEEFEVVDELGSDEAESTEEEPSKIPIHFMLVVLIVVLGVAYMVASSMGEKKQKKEKNEKEAKPAKKEKQEKPKSSKKADKAKKGSKKKN